MLGLLKIFMIFVCGVANFIVKYFSNVFFVQSTLVEEFSFKLCVRFRLHQSFCPFVYHRRFLPKLRTIQHNYIGIITGRTTVLIVSVFISSQLHPKLSFWTKIIVMLKHYFLLPLCFGVIYIKVFGRDIMFFHQVTQY